MDAIFLLLPAGLLAGLIAGLFGVGGGLVFVPVLYFLYTATEAWPEARMHMALGTSLAAILITGLASLRAHQRQQTVEWGVFRRLAPPLAAGALLGAAFAARMDTDWLRRFFGAFECLVALQMLLAHEMRTRRPSLGVWFWAFSGGVIGSVSALLGIGGGTLTVPLLVWSGVPIERAVGTSAACGVPIALAGALGYLAWGRSQTAAVAGFVDPLAVLVLGLGGVALAPLGARLAVHLSRRRLRRLFALFLLLVGLRMFA